MSKPYSSHYFYPFDNRTSIISFVSVPFKSPRGEAGSSRQRSVRPWASLGVRGGGGGVINCRWTALAVDSTSLWSLKWPQENGSRSQSVCVRGRTRAWGSTQNQGWPSAHSRKSCSLCQSRNYSKLRFSPLYISVKICILPDLAWIRPVQFNLVSPLETDSLRVQILAPPLICYVNLTSLKVFEALFPHYTWYS